MRLFIISLLSLSFLFSTQINAQSFDLSMLDKASTLLDSGQQEKSGEVLGSAMGLLTKSAKASGGDFTSKILSQAGVINKMLPALAKGTANVGKIQTVISQIKMLASAMNLSSMVSGGNLLGNSKSLVSNVDVLKSGMSMLGGGAKVNTITKSLDKVTKKAPKLEKSGMFANMAQKAVSKKLESSLSLLGGLL